MTEKIHSFTGLKTWQEGHTLVLKIYEVTTEFPKEEQYCLVQQLRRAAVSITSNIAEGFSKASSKEKLQFYRTALASLTEVQNQLLISRDIGYMQEATFEPIAAQTVLVSKLINGLIKSIKSRTP